MTAPEGGFYTAEDADIEGKEGESYLWTRAEITDVLGVCRCRPLFRPLRADAAAQRTQRPWRIAHPPGPVRLRGERRKPSGSMAELAPLRAKLLEAARPATTAGTRRQDRGGPQRACHLWACTRGESPWRSRMDCGREASRRVLWQHAFDDNSGAPRHYLFQGEPSGEGFLDDYASLGLASLRSARRPATRSGLAGAGSGLGAHGSLYQAGRSGRDLHRRRKPGSSGNRSRRS